MRWEPYPNSSGMCLAHYLILRIRGVLDSVAKDVKLMKGMLMTKQEGPETCRIHHIPLVPTLVGLDRINLCPDCLPRQDDSRGQEDYEAARAHPLSKALIPSEFWP